MHVPDEASLFVTHDALWAFANDPEVDRLKVTWWDEEDECWRGATIQSSSGEPIAAETKAQLMAKMTGGAH